MTPGWLDERLPLRERRRVLRKWRRTRPFWAGLLLMLGGAELLAIPLSPLTVLVSLGLGGLAAIGIGLALIVAGLFLWFMPQSRHYVSINALLLSVLSFAATNLGGFLVGMLLGVAGSAMGFGWTPAAADAEPESASEPGRESGSESGTGEDGATHSGTAARLPSPGDRPGHRTLASVLPVVLLAAVGAPAAADPPADTLRAADGVVAPNVPPTVTTTLFAPKGFLLAGVTSVPTADGPLKVMVLKMKAASLTDYRLTTRDGGRELALGADSLDLSGDVTLYLTRFSGCLEGLICLTFTPDRLPVPPVVPPFVFMTDVDAEQALVTSDRIVADGLTLGTRA
ncbi:DUF6114 domain-containing protein [Streptomyces sp. H27-D2]|nr:DUF6114 domain-containing protein [Streptomyces sp. H27-D2]MEC4019123.1 DUF6114 domain-containing protein [Streptomyces sp. H27-D2]